MERAHAGPPPGHHQLACLTSPSPSAWGESVVCVCVCVCVCACVCAQEATASGERPLRREQERGGPRRRPRPPDEVLSGAGSAAADEGRSDGVGRGGERGRSRRQAAQAGPRSKAARSRAAACVGLPPFPSPVLIRSNQIDEASSRHSPPPCLEVHVDRQDKLGGAGRARWVRLGLVGVGWLVGWGGGGGGGFLLGLGGGGLLGGGGGGGGGGLWRGLACVRGTTPSP
jgi:hypothetical protein